MHASHSRKIGLRWNGGSALPFPDPQAITVPHIANLRSCRVGDRFPKSKGPRCGRSQNGLDTGRLDGQQPVHLVLQNRRIVVIEVCLKIVC